MRKIFLMMGLFFYTFQVVLGQCSCRSNIVVGTDYRDILNTPIPGGIPIFTPSTLAAAQAAGNMIALYIYNAPCNPTIGFVQTFYANYSSSEYLK